MVELIALGFPLTAGLVDFAAAVVAITAVRERRLSYSLAALCSILGVWSFAVAAKAIPGLFESYPSAVAMLEFALILLPAAGLRTAVEFSGLHGRGRWALLLPTYALTVFFLTAQTGNQVFAGYSEYPGGTFASAGALLAHFFVFTIAVVILSVASCVEAVRSSRDRLIVLRCKYWLLGLGLFVPLACVNFLVSFGVPTLPLGSLGNILLVGLYTYAVARHRVLDVSTFVLSMTARITTCFFISPPVIAGSIWMLGSNDLGTQIASFSLGVVALCIAVHSYRGVRDAIEEAFERSVLPRRHRCRRELRKLAQRLLGEQDPEALCDDVTRTLCHSIDLEGSACYLRVNESSFQSVSRQGKIATPRTWIEPSRRIDSKTGPTTDCLPVGSDSELLGFIAVGPKVSGAALDDSDMTLLTMVAAQLAIALKNAEYVDKIRAQKDVIDELRKRAEAENVVLRSEVKTHAQFQHIVGESPALIESLCLVEKAAPTELPLLVLGETGTGKELFARAIHEHSTRRDGPLISVNCPAIPEELAETELFGAERGAFTGATQTRPGRFEIAHGGTLFLDEVADLPLSIQTKLLRVIQESEIQRVGSPTTRKVDVRIVAATNRDLLTEAKRGTFREDLIYRLQGMTIRVPPLRDRLGDVPILASFFLERANRSCQKNVEGITPEAIDVLSRYNWPGNVRELQHVIERAVLLCAGKVIRPQHLSDLALPGTYEADPADSLSTVIRDEKIRRVEDALEQTRGNQAAAARILGMSRSNLGRLMKRYGIVARRQPSRQSGRQPMQPPKPPPAPSV